MTCPRDYRRRRSAKRSRSTAEAHGPDDPSERRDRRVSIAEAVLLSIVALMTAWYGYAAAKWSTESRVELAEASTLRSEANRANINAIDLRNFDSSTFNAWFSAYTVNNKQAMALAERRFRPAVPGRLRRLGRTHPETNPQAPKGPTDMPQYKQPGLAKTRRLDDQATAAFAAAETAGENSDQYVRATVFLATILFLVGISTRFPLRGWGYALVVLGAVLLVFTTVHLTQLPGPPT